MKREELRELIVGAVATVSTPFDDDFNVDNGRIADLFQKASESQQSEMYQEIVAMKMTVPLCAAIVHWLAEGWKLDGEKLDAGVIPMAIRHVIGVIIMQL